MNWPTKIIQNKFVVLIFCLIFSFLLFSNTFQNDFVFDDIPVIRDNQILKDIKNLPKLFTSYYYHNPAGLYRPLQMVSYAINYFLFGSDVWSFHFVNILLHGLNCWLLYLFIFKLTTNYFLAWLTCWFFLILPIHTEAVTGLVGRAELLCFFFSFLTLLILISEQTKKWYLFLLNGCFFLALLSKETAFSVIPICISIYIWRYGLKNIINFKNLKIIKNISVLVFIFSIYLTIRYLVLGPYFLNNNATVVENPLKFVSTLPRILTAFKVLSLYIWKIIFPINLSSDYSYNQIPIVESFNDTLVLVGIIFFSILIYPTLRYIFSSQTSFLKQKFNFNIFYFGSIIFLWPYLLISNLITPIGTIMGERLMYFPSAGICLIISNFILNLFSNKMSKIYRFFAIVVLLSFSIFYIIRTYIRNFDWKDQTTLFISAAKVSPNSVLSRSNLGAVYLLSGDYIRAEKEILAANKIYPYYPPAVNNLGLIYKWKKDYKKAEELFIKAINIAGYPPAVENLALVYFEQGRFKEAKEMLKIFFQNDQTKVQNYLFSLFYNKIQQALKQGDQKLVKELQKKAEEILNKD